ncbi:MAG: methyltransferase domain-containing protein [Acidimicrobiales bacterium]
MTSGGGGNGGGAASLPLLDLLCCPDDRAAPLVPDGDDLVCPKCARRYPVSDGMVSVLSAQHLSEQDGLERRDRDVEASWYDAMFEGYTNAVEVPAGVRRIGRPSGVILDAGCGTGRITEALLPLGQPIVAVDYSEPTIRLMQARIKGTPVPVLAIQSDLRALPLRDGVIAATTCIEVYAQLRPADRRTFLGELHRVMRPGAVLSMSAYNYNLMFKAWRRLGNGMAREGQHMLGGEYYFARLTREDYRRELERLFDVEELTGIRNIPARTLAGGLRKVRLRRAGDRFLDFMVARGRRADFALERLPAVAGLVGFFWQARARRRA